MKAFDPKLIAGVMLIACAIAFQFVVSLSVIAPGTLAPFIQGDGFLPYTALALPPFSIGGALKADDMYGTLL